MNKTEKKAHEWILSTLKKEPTFQRRKSPDFVCSDGSGYEIKLLRSNAITFSSSQFETLREFPYDLKIVVFDDGEEPIAIIPFPEIRENPKYWGKIRIAIYERDWEERVIYIRIEEKDRDALKIKAGKLGLTLTGYCRMLMLKSL